ncbi:MAG TPA: DUF378 domain-containing protein [Candidatus Paceibacterota bacterium]|jgi:uncharacterized membrane protein YuzA (DUF378 family)|nr:DUF378 domain-containing protein [Candidatus Paceibacterota bacterium]
MKLLHIVAVILVAIGGINWGLIGLAGLMGMDPMSWNVVHALLGSSMQLEWGIYLLVGVSAIWTVVTHRADCKQCR